MMNRYLTPMLVIAVSVGVYFYVIDPRYKNIAQQLAQERVIEGFIIDANDAKNLLDKVIADHRSFPPDADHRLNVLLPDTIDPARLIIDINAVASRHGLAVGSPAVLLGAANAEEPNRLLEHEVSFKIVATYSTFRKFLWDVESSLAIRDFNAVSFASTAALEEASKGVAVNPEFEILFFDVYLKVYSLR